MLTDEMALENARQLMFALDKLEERHCWDPGDTVAVAIVALTEIIGKRIGPTKTIELFRGHADELESEHLRRASA